MNLKEFFDLLPYEVLEEKFRSIDVKFDNVVHVADYIWIEPDDDIILVWATKKGAKAHTNIKDYMLEIDNTIAIKFVFERL